MKDYMHRQQPLLEIIKGLSPKQARTLLPYLSSDCHDALCLCVHNAILNFKKLDVDVGELQKVMAPDHKKYRYLSDKRVTKSDKVFAERADILEQTGEGLPLILSAVLPLLTSLFAPK